MISSFKLDQSDVWPGCRLIEVVGELDLAVSARLGAALERARTEHRHVLLDLGRCEFIDASGLSVLVAAAASLKQDGRRLVLLGVHGQVRRVLTVTGLARRRLRIGRDREPARPRAAAPVAVPTAA